MNKSCLYIKPLSFAIFCIMILAFSSCEGNFKEIQKIYFSEFTPSIEVENFNLKYTEVGAIKSVLESPKMLDYTNVKYPFTEFPLGVHVSFFDTKGNVTVMDARYAVSYKETQIIDLQGDVKITTNTGQVLETQQLYYDQKNKWFFTDKKFKFTDPKGISYGEGIDFSDDFKIVNSQGISGEISQL